MLLFLQISPVPAKLSAHPQYSHVTHMQATETQSHKWYLYLRGLNNEDIGHIVKKVSLTQGASGSLSLMYTTTYLYNYVNALCNAGSVQSAPHFPKPSEGGDSTSFRD